MQGWNHQFLFPELIAKEDLVGKSSCAHQGRADVSVSDQVATLHTITQSLRQLQHSIVELDLEAYWVDKLLSYLQRLRITLPAQAPKDQFSQLLTLRKWLFWVPVALLKRRGTQGPAILILAHLYAALIVLEPLFPDLGTSFCSALTLPVLENILQITTAMRIDYGLGSAWPKIISWMEYCQNGTCNHCSRTLQNTSSKALQMNQATYNFNLEPTFNTTTSGCSLAYAYPTLHQGPAASVPASVICHSYHQVLPPRYEKSSIDYDTSAYVVMPSPQFPIDAHTLALNDEM
jgi:hypothetical protein